MRSGTAQERLALTYSADAYASAREAESFRLCLKLMSKENNDPG